MSMLAAREGYRLWAPTYESETAVSALEALEVTALGEHTAGKALLDVGCGTARRMRDARASFAVGVDVTPEMLAHSRPMHGELVAAADARALPFASDAFDVVWCRLMIGHLADISAAVRELSRVCKAGGAVVISDISAAAVAAGHRRTFRDTVGAVREVEHHVHEVALLDALAGNADMVLTVRRTGCVGPAIEPFYAAAGRPAMYAAQCGQPLVVVSRYEKRVAR